MKKKVTKNGEKMHSKTVCFVNMCLLPVMKNLDSHSEKQESGLFFSLFIYDINAPCFFEPKA
jgi:hypothetical protein